MFANFQTMNGTQHVIDLATHDPEDELFHALNRGPNVPVTLALRATSAQRPFQQRFPQWVQRHDLVGVLQNVSAPGAFAGPRRLGVAPFGSRSVCVIVANMRNGAAACDASCVASFLFTGAFNVAGVYAFASYGQVTFSQSRSTIVTVTLPSAFSATSSKCDYLGIAAAAEAAAIAAGVNPLSFQHQMYSIPRVPGCNWGGLAAIGCATSSAGRCQTWVRSYTSQTYGHELGGCHQIAVVDWCVWTSGMAPCFCLFFVYPAGHNLGMSHASGDVDNNGVKDPALIGGEYHASDLMVCSACLCSYTAHAMLDRLRD